MQGDRNNSLLILKFQNMDLNKIYPIIFFLLLLISTNKLIAQSNRKNEISFRIGPQVTKESSLFGVYRGSDGIETNIGYEFGLAYSLKLKNRFWLSRWAGLLKFYK